MPHVNSSGGDDLASTDEVKVYTDEGEEEKRSSENLSEDKLGLVTESEEVNLGEDNNKVCRVEFGARQKPFDLVCLFAWMCIKLIFRPISRPIGADFCGYIMLLFLCFRGKVRMEGKENEEGVLPVMVGARTSLHNSIPAVVIPVQRNMAWRRVFECKFLLSRISLADSKAHLELHIIRHTSTHTQSSVF